MKNQKVFASIMFVRADYSSGIDKHEIEYNPALSAMDYIDFFLNKTRNNCQARRVQVFSLELSEHDENGNYLFDKFDRIKRKPFMQDMENERHQFDPIIGRRPDLNITR